MPALLSEFLPFILALVLGFSYKRLGILTREDGRVIARLVVNVTFVVNLISGKCYLFNIT